MKGIYSESTELLEILASWLIEEQNLAALRYDRVNVASLKAPVMSG